jgi:hypothetical protein
MHLAPNPAAIGMGTCAYETRRPKEAWAEQKKGNSFEFPQWPLFEVADFEFTQVPRDEP